MRTAALFVNPQQPLQGPTGCCVYLEGQPPPPLHELRSAGGPVHRLQRGPPVHEAERGGHLVGGGHAGQRVLRAACVPVRTVREVGEESATTSKPERMCESRRWLTQAHLGRRTVLPLVSVMQNSEFRAA